MSPRVDQNMPEQAKSKVDMATVGGLSLALAGILGGLLLEGGHIADVAQFTAALIVLGGTLGAVMITTPLPLLLAAAKKARLIFFDVAAPTSEALELIIAYAIRARSNGIISLEEDVEKIQDPFLKKALSLAVDGTDLQELKSIMETDLQLEERQGEAEAKVFEAAGGYAPTIGIIGAVLGLIQVMKHLENIEEVGRGIAVAFVATVYGVASANIFFLPAANKLKARFQRSIRTKEMMLDGVCNIAEGLNPKLIRIRLEAYIKGDAPAAARPARKEAAPRTAAAQAGS